MDWAKFILLFSILNTHICYLNIYPIYLYLDLLFSVVVNKLNNNLNIIQLNLLIYYL